MAPSSAYVNAPASDSNPATAHAASTSIGEPTSCAMTPALKYTPVPMIVPITSAVVLESDRPRTSCWLISPRTYSWRNLLTRDVMQATMLGVCAYQVNRVRRPSATIVAQGSAFQYLTLG